MTVRVLVIDDDAGIADAIVFALEEEGYAVDRVLDGLKVWDAIGAHTPDVIILDILMSGHDGAEIAQWLKSHPATQAIPIIMSSAHPHGAQMAHQAGAQDFLPKPFDIYHLISLVEKYTQATPVQ